jgi:hypothetical protein
MNDGRFAPAFDADFVEIGEQRQGDRRTGERRAAHLKLDLLFAATLLNHFSAPERGSAHGYALPSRGPRAGVIRNVSA